MDKIWALDGTRLKLDSLSRPCGLLAKHFPRDSFRFKHVETKKTINVTHQNIAWPGLVGKKFKSVNKSLEWANIEDERFINWMRPNTGSNVYKSWGKFEEGMKAGVYLVTIFNGIFLSHVSQTSILDCSKERSCSGFLF
jgi:hypothetical protein